MAQPKNHTIIAQSDNRILRVAETEPGWILLEATIFYEDGGTHVKRIALCSDELIKIKEAADKFITDRDKDTSVKPTIQ